MLILGGLLVNTLTTLFVIVCVLMILIVLVQRPKGGGLAGAFGGGGGSQAFGAKTGDVLTWITVGAFVIFLLLGMCLAWFVTEDTGLGRADPIEKTSSSSPEIKTTTPDKPITPPADKNSDTEDSTE